MKHVIMANPVSGKKKGQKYALVIQKLLKKYGVDSDIILSKYSGELKEKAQEISSHQPTRFYCVGGDGTLNEIVSGIIGTESEIVVLPCGTGNDFAKYSNEYNSLRKIILTSLNTPSTKCDVIKLNNHRYCINILNAGFDALIAYNLKYFRNIPLLNGTAKYNLSIVYTLFTNRNYRLRIKTDKISETGKYTLVCLCNGRYYGGGVVPSKRSEVDDGKLSVCKILSTSLPTKLLLLPKYKSCKHEGLKQVYIDDDTHSFLVVSNHKFPLSIDGEVIFTNRVKASILKDAVNIVKIKK